MLKDRKEFHLSHPVLSMPELKRRWATTGVRYKLSQNRVMVVVTFVSSRDNRLVWSCGAKIVNTKKKTMPPVSMWSKDDVDRVSRKFLEILEGVGVEGTEEVFNSELSTHVVRDLTEEELAELEEKNPTIAAQRIIPIKGEEDGKEG